MPSVNELQTLINYGASPANHAIFDTGCAPGCTVLTCSCTAPSFYWSSTTNFGTPFNAWGVLFDLVDVYSFNKATSFYYVRAVRGGS